MPSSALPLFYLYGETPRITLATPHLHRLCERDHELWGLFRDIGVVTLHSLDAEHVQARTKRLMQEYAWANPGYRSALDAGLLDLMVVALRGSPAAHEPQSGSQVELVARLRQRIEERFHLRESIVEYARGLRVSLHQLRTACAQIARLSPLELLDQRSMLEARRALLYSDRTIKEVAFSLGFTDVAYFSRFFSRHAGCSPRAYRQRKPANTTHL